MWYLCSTDYHFLYTLKTFHFLTGQKNSFETVDVKFVNFTNPWSPGNYIVQSKLHSTEHKNERSAAFRFGKKLPRHVLVSNPSKKNKWGHQRSYRIQYNSHADTVLPKGWKEENGISWSRYRDISNDIEIFQIPMLW